MTPTAITRTGTFPAVTATPATATVTVTHQPLTWNKIESKPSRIHIGEFDLEQLESSGRLVIHHV
jgi:hypothetical protein